MTRTADSCPTKYFYLEYEPLPRQQTSTSSSSLACLSRFVYCISYKLYQRDESQRSNRRSWKRGRAERSWQERTWRLHHFLGAFTREQHALALKDRHRGNDDTVGLSDENEKRGGIAFNDARGIVGNTIVRHQKCAVENKYSNCNRTATIVNRSPVGCFSVRCVNSFNCVRKPELGDACSSRKLFIRCTPDRSSCLTPSLLLVTSRSVTGACSDIHHPIGNARLRGNAPCWLAFPIANAASNQRRSDELVAAMLQPRLFGLGRWSVPLQEFSSGQQRRDAPRRFNWRGANRVAKQCQ